MIQLLFSTSSSVAVNDIRRQSANLLKDIEGFNKKLPDGIRGYFSQRKKQLEKQEIIVESIGIPLKVAKEIKPAFKIPATRKKAFKTTSSGKDMVAFEAEPALDQDVYDHILNVLFQVGRVFERLPRIHEGRDEETLRDILILWLEPQVEGETTGETFNGDGKTDILLRYKSKNAFVGECKFWSGPENHTDTINQILGNLTWRDSKAAIIYFFKQKDMTSLLGVIEKETPKHQHCIKLVEIKEEGSWFSFEFCLPEDKGKRVQLAVLCFATPEKEIRKDIRKKPPRKKAAKKKTKPG